VRNKAFDMVSDGERFKLWIPPKNRFVVGRNDVETNNPARPLENLRPQHIYDALLLRRVDPQNEIAVLENDTELVTEAKSRKVSRADYVIDVIRKEERGWVLSRKIVFSRTDLLPHRQLLYEMSPRTPSMKSTRRRTGWNSPGKSRLRARKRSTTLR
jgi:hypothetical protein